MNVLAGEQRAGTAASHPATYDYADSAVDLRRLIGGVWRRRRLMFAIVVAVMGLVIAFLLTATPKYTSEAQVLVENGESPFTRPQQEAPLQLPSVTEDDVRSQAQVLMSHDLGERVVEALQLYKYPEFDPVSRGLSPVRQLLVTLGLSSDPRDTPPQQRALRAYFDKLIVYPITGSRVITIEFTSKDPRIAAEVANTLAENYVTSTQEVKFGHTQKAVDWLAEQIELLRDEVVKSEAAVERYRAEHGLFQAETTTLNTQELAGINSQIILAAAARSEAQARARAIREMLDREGGVEASADVLNSELIQRLREQQVALQRQMADLSMTYLPSHPRMQRLQSEIDNLSSEIRREALKIVEGLEQEASVQGSREAALRASLNELKERTATSNQYQVQLRALEREAAANRELLESFLRRYSEASARQDVLSLPPSARIISRAQVLSSPSFPKTGAILALGLVGSVVLALVVAFLAEVLSPAAGPATATATTGSLSGNGTRLPPAPPPPPPAPAVAVLTELPPVADASGPERRAAEVVRTPASPYTVAMHTLAEAVHARLSELGGKRILVTSPADDETRAVTAAGLARVFALRGLNPVVIDADSDADLLQECYGLGTGPGLAEFLAGHAAFADVVAADPQSGAAVVRAGADVAGARALVGSDRMAVLLDALDRSYDVALVVAGPSDDPAVRALAGWVQYCVMVAPDRATGEAAVTELAQQPQTVRDRAEIGLVIARGDSQGGRLFARRRQAA